MKKLPFLLILIFFSCSIFGQEKKINNIDKLLLKGHYNKAIRQLEKRPKSYNVFDKLGSIYQTVGNYTEAIIYYKKAFSINNNAEVNVKLGNVYNLAGFKTEAVNTYEDIIKKDSSNYLILTSLGKIYLSERQPKKAEKIFRYLIKKDSLNPNFSFLLAESLSKQQKFLEMGQSYLDSYKLDTMHLRSIYELAKFFKKLRIKDSTNLFIDKGLKIDSLSINFNLLKAQDLYYSKQFKESIKILNRLEKLNYRSVTTYEMLGMCYYNLKEYNLAEKSFNKGLKIDFNNSQLHYRMASLYYDLKKYKLSEVNAYMSIFSATPKLDKQYFLLGLIANDKNNLKIALKNFKKAFASNSNNYKALFQLALTTDTYYKDKKKGLVLYQKYLYRFKSKNKENTLFAKSRVKAIKKGLFLKGEKIN